MHIISEITDECCLEAGKEVEWEKSSNNDGVYDAHVNSYKSSASCKTVEFSETGSKRKKESKKKK